LKTHFENSGVHSRFQLLQWEFTSECEGSFPHTLCIPGSMWCVGSPSWPATLQPLTLVASPRLGLWQLVVYFFISWQKVHKILKILFIAKYFWCIFLKTHYQYFYIFSLNFNPWWSLDICYFFSWGLKLLMILLLHKQQLWIHKHYCNLWISSCCA
jgi:hypothetical protein